MIVLLHLLVNIVHKIYNHLNKRHSSWKNFTITKLNADSHPIAVRDTENDLKFDPPMYKQRYERAMDILMYYKWQDQIDKVVDFGCSEFGFFVFLKNRIQAGELIFVDIDELLLQDYLYRVYPLNADYLARRSKTLTVKVFVGNIAYPDPNLLQADAVVALEVIEHLYPDVLEAMPYNLFSYVCPKLVIFTTPNSEFNVLFQKVDKFRHPDHKFEWTREQFQAWATNITLRFPRYMVLFDEIGLGPTGFESCGCCSQLAVFVRKDIVCDNYIEDNLSCVCMPYTCNAESQNSSCCLCECLNCLPKQSYGICTNNSKSQEAFQKKLNDGYKLIFNIDYPHECDTRTEEERNLDELKYRIHLSSSNECYYNFEKDRIEIPLHSLVYETSGSFLSESFVRSTLLKFDYQIEECLNQETKQLESCVIYDLEMASGGSGSDTGASGYGSDRRDIDDGQLSDWEENEKVAWADSAAKAVKKQLHLEVSSSSKQEEALFDSGYQKSPSVSDESPQLNKESPSVDLKTPSSDKPNKLSNILSVFENFDKINELDAFHKEKKYFNFSSNLPQREVMKKICQEIAKHPIAGPSRDSKKGKHSKKAHSSDTEDSVEDVKSITTCILENSLNRIECIDEEPKRSGLIQELIPLENPLNRIECNEEEQRRADLIQELIPEENAVELNEPIQPGLVVENGDLANNNRDLEGNNYPENVEYMELENDNAVDNVEHNNVNANNNNEINVPEEVEPEFEENPEIEPLVNIEVAWSSREALFDINSQVDLLEEFDIDDSVAVVNGVAFPNNYVVVADNSAETDESVLPPAERGFPNWLLQIFEEGEASVVPEEELHDEPHFYCQGDGLGVHPSTVAINDDADDEGNGSGSDSTTSSSTSSSDSVNFANTENHLVPNVSPPGGLGNDSLAVVGQPVSVTHQNSSVELPEEEETFESAEGSESSLLTSTQ